MRREGGQATIEWVGLVCLVCAALGALTTAAVSVADVRSLGGFLAHRLTCTARGACDRGTDALALEYGDRDAELVRRYAPNLVYERGERSLPVDYRECRSVVCAAAPDDPGLDAHRTDAGLSATAFTHVLRRGGRTYLQYFLYYPDSNSSVLGSDRIWKAIAGQSARASEGTPAPYPGEHADDWEGYQVRLERDGRVAVRATSHGHYQWCKHSRCRGRWGPLTGWTRVSKGSHAGHLPLRQDPPHVRSRYRIPYSRGGPVMGYNPDTVGYTPEIPGRDTRERSSSAEGLRLVPLEGLDHAAYRPLDPAITPPWDKAVYSDPESDES